MHHRLHRVFLLAFIALAAVVAGAVPAVAQTPDGRVQADGTGAVTAEGRLVMIANASARGGTQVRVLDRQGDAVVTVNGLVQSPRVTKAGNEYRFKQNGRFSISGSWVGIEVRGDAISASVAGAGTFRASGKGALTVNEGPSQAWSRQLIVLGTGTPPPPVKAPAAPQKPGSRPGR